MSPGIGGIRNDVFYRTILSLQIRRCVMGCTKCKHRRKAFREDPCHPCYKRFLKDGTAYTKFKSIEDSDTYLRAGVRIT